MLAQFKNQDELESDREYIQSRVHETKEIYREHCKCSVHLYNVIYMFLKTMVVLVASVTEQYTCNWCWPKGSESLTLRGCSQAWQEVIAAYCSVCE